MIEAGTRNTAESVADGIAYCEEATTAIFHAARESPRSNPIVSFCSEKFLLCLAAAAEQARQDHLRLQNDLADLSTNSRHLMVPDSGHEIYLYKPEVVVRSINAVVSSTKDHSQVPSIE